MIVRMSMYKVIISDWGEYVIVAPNRETAAFYAGMKWQRECPPIQPGEWKEVDVIVPGDIDD